MKFGSQSAGDSTAEREKWIQEAADERVQRLNELDVVLNRPIGSLVNRTKEEKLADWEFRLSHPEELTAQIQERAQVTGIDRAVFELLSWDKEMQELSDGTTD